MVDINRGIAEVSSIRVDFLVRCLGEDRKIHRCTPDSGTALCGVLVINKKLNDGDASQYFSCYECTY